MEKQLTNDIGEFVKELGLAGFHGEGAFVVDDDAALNDEEESDGSNMDEFDGDVVDGEEDMDSGEDESNNDESSEKQSKSRPKPTQNSENVKRKGKNKFKVQDSEVSSSSTSKLDDTDNVSLLGVHSNRKHPLIALQRNWYTSEFASEEKHAGKKNFSALEIERMKTKASKLIEVDTKLYTSLTESKQKTKSSQKWMLTIAGQGTITDKLAALTIQVQSSPVHNLNNLSIMSNMLKKKGRRFLLMVMDTLKELWLSDLLPDRKFIAFEQRPFQVINSLNKTNASVSNKKLMMWYFEDQLKEKYGSFVKEVENISHDQMIVVKKKCMSIMFELLRCKPEQEKQLLEYLVNKLGDPLHKIAAQAAHMLSRLVDEHPMMKEVVVMEVERVLYRPNISQKAQYYAICFLNQVILSRKITSVAVRLISIYFSFFKASVKKKDMGSKMLSGLLTGVNRAYPFAKESKEVLDQMDILYKIVAVSPFNIGLQALMLLYQVSDSHDQVSNRYYMALYRKLADSGVQDSCRQSMYLNLLYKSMKNDVVEKRVLAFLKRLVQFSSFQSPPFICGVLIAVSSLLSERPSLLLLDKKSSDHVECRGGHVLTVDDDDEHFYDVIDDDDNDNESLKGKMAPLPESSSWVHRRNIHGRASELTEYDPSQRNPLYAAAEKTFLWEICKLVNHYHPTVALYANHILQRTRIEYDGDPLSDYTVIRFLDRFVFRNPKKPVEGTKPELAHAKRILKRVKGPRTLPVTSDEYVKLKEDDVPTDEKFMFQYFQKKAADKDLQAQDEDVSDDEFDEILDKYEHPGDRDFKFHLMDFTSKASNKKRKKEKVDSDDDIDDADLDEEVDFDMDDEEFIDVSDVDDEVGGNGPKNKRKTETFGKRSGGMFASADDFEDMLEVDDDDEGLAGVGGSQDVSNPEHAHAKQLKWEQARDEWVKNKSWRNKKSRKHMKHAPRTQKRKKQKRSPWSRKAARKQ